MNYKIVSRAKLLDTLRQMTPTAIVMEACYSANPWGRAIESLGHTVKLIPPYMVKPFVIGNKNDHNDALPIAEAALRPKVKFVAVKSLAQQDVQSLQRIRDHLINEEISMLSDQIKVIEKDLYDILATYEYYHRLQTIPGIGPVAATTFISAISDANHYKNGRQLAAWVGLTPKQHSSGEKSTMGKISKRGNGGLRRVLIHGARAVMNWRENKTDPLNMWVKELLLRAHPCKVIVALANKLARIAWAVLARKENYSAAALAK